MGINRLEKLKKACMKYGIDPGKAQFFDNVIAVPGSVEGLYVLFDNNYNTIDIRKFIGNGPKNFGDYVEGLYSMYRDDFVESFYLDDVRATDSEYLSVSHVVDITDNYEVKKSNRGRSSVLFYKGEVCRDNIDDDTVRFISYIQFLRKMIDDYFVINYKMKEKNISFPTVDRYVEQIVREINFYIERCIMMERRPDPIEFIDLSENKSLYIDQCELMANFFELLLRNRGYKSIPRQYDGIMPLNGKEAGTVNINQMIRDAKMMRKKTSGNNKAHQKHFSKINDVKKA